MSEPWGQPSVLILINNDDGDPYGYDDVFKMIERTRNHYIKVGLGYSYIDQILR